MKKKLEKMLLYLDLIEQSKWKENNIAESIFYTVFATKEEQRDKLKEQVKVTKRLENRVETLKKEL